MSTKTVQGKLWSIAPRYWSRHIEPYFLRKYHEVFSKVKLNHETLLLDAGCGSGLFSSLAIKKNTQVIGIDAAPGLLKIARERNPKNNFMKDDLESIAFNSDSFNIITGFNSFQYAGSFENLLTPGKARIENRRALGAGHLGQTRIE